MLMFFASPGNIQHINYLFPDDFEDNTFQTEINEESKYFEVEIMNEYNKVVFHSSNQHFTWKGECLNGSIATSGIYYFTVKFITKTDMKYHSKCGIIYLKNRDG